MTDCHDCSCSTNLGTEASEKRAHNLTHAKHLAIITIAWNCLEGIVALVLGFTAGSVALVGFGLDSAIETASAAIVGWRFWSEEKARDKKEELERNAAKLVGVLLLCLAAYVTLEAIRKLAGAEPHAKESPFGIGLTATALVVMPLLAHAKYKSARALSSAAMKAEAFQSLTCAWLAASTLLGLILNMLFHWSWADPLAAILFVPAIIKEGIEALRGKFCADCH